MKKPRQKRTEPAEMPKFYIIWQSELLYNHQEFYGEQHIAGLLCSQFDPKYAGCNDYSQACERAKTLAKEYPHPYDTVMVINNQGICLGRCFYDMKLKNIIWINDAY